MAETIAPVVHGGRRGRWAVAVAFHVLGTTAAAAAFGALVAGAGGLLAAPWGAAGPVTLAALCLAYAARDLLGLGVPVPCLKRQVPEWWRTYFSPNAAALLYGLGLGVGFFTYLRHGTLLVVTAAAAVSGRPWVGAALLGAFGLARGLSVVATRRAATERTLRGVMTRLDRLAAGGLARWANGVALVGLGGAAVVASGTASGVAETLLPVTLGVAFSWAAVAKAVAPHRWRRALEAYGLPAPLPAAAFVAVPILEVGVAAVALFGPTRAAGVAAAVALVPFSAALVRARRRHGDRVPCGCFGGTARRDYRVLLARNAALGAVAMACAMLDPAPPLRAADVQAPAAAEVVPAALVAAGLVAGIAALRGAFRLLRRGGTRVQPASGWQDGQR